MGVMAKVLDSYRAARGFTSDNALSAEIGISRQTVSQWRNEIAYPEEERFIELCDAAKLDAEAWMAAIRAERADGEARARWMHAARRLGYAAMICLAVYTSILTASPALSNTIRSGAYYVKFLGCAETGSWRT